MSDIPSHPRLDAHTRRGAEFEKDEKGRVERVKRHRAREPKEERTCQRGGKHRVHTLIARITCARSPPDRHLSTVRVQRRRTLSLPSSCGHLPSNAVCRSVLRFCVPTSSLRLTISAPDRICRLAPTSVIAKLRVPSPPPLLRAVVITAADRGAQIAQQLTPRRRDMAASSSSATRPQLGLRSWRDMSMFQTNEMENILGWWSSRLSNRAPWQAARAQSSPYA